MLVQTAGEAVLARKANEVEPGSLRHQVLLSARKFKSSWVELGAMLVKVRAQSAFEQWGFASFEEYCSKELRIKRATALKLTTSYSFLSRHEKGLLPREVGPDSPASEKAREVPAFEVVSVLAGAEERGQLSEADYRSLRESIWSDETPAPQLARELSERFPPPPRPAPPAERVVRRLAQMARRFAGEVRSCKKVPEAVCQRAEALADDLEELASNG
jgi:hypothetical protein